MKIGIDIGGSHIAVGLVENNGNIVVKKEKTLTVKIEKIQKSLQKKQLQQP